MQAVFDQQRFYLGHLPEPLGDVYMKVLVSHYPASFDIPVDKLARLEGLCDKMSHPRRNGHRDGA